MPIRIEIMISSRCEDKIRKVGGGSVKLTDVRKRAKKSIESALLFGYETFDCWIHEDKPALPADANAWEKCLSQVKRCHILVILYNGNAGFGRSSEDIGICHAELMAALNTGPGKVRLIDVSKAAVGDIAGDPDRNKRFVDYVESQDLARRFADNDDEALKLIVEAVQDAVIFLTDKGANSLRVGRYATGAPLDWSRLDYAQRKSAIEAVLRQTMHPKGSSDETEICTRNINGVPIYFACHAVPAGMNVAAAREMVGRPFLRDQDSLSFMNGDVVGPVHVIGCHKTVTENQAVSMLGFPDATIVTPEFGIYVADDVLKIQLIFLTNCRDDSSTRNRVQSFHEWLERSGEARYLARRAVARKAIVSVIAAQASNRVTGEGG
jgi:hypothetical protein